MVPCITFKSTMNKMYTKNYGALIFILFYLIKYTLSLQKRKNIVNGNNLICWQGYL